MSETNTQPFANVRSAKIGSELSPIGRGLLQIGPFCFPAYIFRDDELQEALLGFNPLTKRGCSATFTNETFSLFHDLNKEPILHGSKTTHQNSWRVEIQQYHEYPMLDFTSPTGFYETPHDWDTTICSNKRPTPLPRTWAEFQIKPEQYLHHPTWDLLSPAEFYETVREWDWNEIDGHTPSATMRAKEWLTLLPDTPTPKSLSPATQRVSSSGNQRVSLLGKQRVSEESRTDLNHILNASDLQTNNDHISKWEQARESEFTTKILMSKILMSKSIRYGYQDTSYADPDKSIHLQMHNELQFNWTNSNISAQCPTPGNNASTVSHPQPPVPSGHNDRSVRGFSTGFGPKNQHIDVHFHGTDVTTRAIPDTKFNELHNLIKSDTHFWN